MNVEAVDSKHDHIEVHHRHHHHLRGTFFRVSPTTALACPYHLPTVSLMPFVIKGANCIPMPELPAS